MPRPHPARHRATRFLALALALVLAVSQSGTRAGSGNAGGAQVDPSAAPPPNIIFLIDLSTAMDQNCCWGIPCLQDVKRALLETRRHNDWVNMGVIGTETAGSPNSYFPIAPVGSSTAEVAKALRNVTASGGNSRNFGQSLVSLTYRYLAWGWWKSLFSPTTQDVIAASCQETHVITITKALPNDDPYAYDTVADWLYTTDLRSNLAGTQNVITHTIQVLGFADDKNYEGASVVTMGNGLFITVVNYQELQAAIAQVLKHVRSDHYVRSATLLNTDKDMLLYLYHEAWQDDPVLKGQLQAYRIETDKASENYGQVLENPEDPFGGAIWDAGTHLEARIAASGERNPLVRTGKTSTRAIYTFVPGLMNRLSTTSATYREAVADGRMSFDAQFVDDVWAAGQSSLFVRSETYATCSGFETDEGKVPGNSSSSGASSSSSSSSSGSSSSSSGSSATSGIVTVYWDTSLRKVTVTSTKTITAVKLDFGAGVSQTFSSLSVMNMTAAGTGTYLNKPIIAVSVTSNKKTVTLQNDLYPSLLNFQGTLRDFTPTTNPDFQRIIKDDRGIVNFYLGADGKPVHDLTEADPTITSTARFNEWYRDVAGVNQRMDYTVPLTRASGSTIFTYNNSSFFPLDGKLFGNYGTFGHNYHFTLDVHGEFTYGGGEYFQFTGDDDLWVFINGRLAIDIGGVHAPQSATANLDSLAGTLGITKGMTYPIDFFFAERHTVQSNFKIATTMVINPVEDGSTGSGMEKYVLCHVPPGNPANAHTITIAKPAVVNAHLKNHDGDHLGPCDPGDLTGDAVVDKKDLQYVVDFVRGVPTLSIKYLQEYRDEWKLGPSPHSIPTVISSSSVSASHDTSYVAFAERLRERHEAGDPDLVVVASNDATLHAFNLETGEEVWAWVPSQPLLYDQPTTWSGRVIEQVWYGQTDVFDGTPVVEDLWIDADGDNQPEEDGSEWHRVLVVQQGVGGPSTLALDVTDTNEPRFLWERTFDASDVASMGQSVSRPVLGSVLDRTREGVSEVEVPVAIWASGKAAAAEAPTDNYSKSEANLFIQSVGDDFWGSSSVSYDAQGSNGGLVPTSLNTDVDADGRNEAAYIAGSLTAVDVNFDGSVDVLYFPLTTTFEPTDMGDPDGDGVTGTSDVSDPGYTWMYKAILDPDDPENPTWCPFYDPKPATGDRAEVYYAATASWQDDGTLGIYWGTGGPEVRGVSDPGYIFAMKDPTPCECNGSEPISTFDGDGVLTLGAGEALTWEPIIYGGVLYFTTYTPACLQCNTGESRIYGVSYDTAGFGLDLDGDGRPDSISTTVEGPVGSIKISEQGVLFYGTSRSRVTGGEGISVGTLPLISSLNESVLPITWADIF